MILVSHNIVTCKDEKYPASISKTWHDILREELKFSGLILTDDLSMDAIKKYSGDESPAVLAINAGNDVILTSDYYEHLNAVINATNNNIISEEIINKACRRVIAWKIKYLINSEKDDDEKEEEEQNEEEEEKNQKKEEEDDNDKGQDQKDDTKNDHTVLIICLVLGGIILIIIIIVIIKFFLFKKEEKSSNDDSIPLESKKEEPIIENS